MAAMQTDQPDLNDSLQEIDGLVTQLCQEQDETRCDQITDRLLDISQSLIGLDTGIPQNQATEVQLQTCAIALWNVAVARKAGGCLHQELNAKVRHLACNLQFSFASSRESFISLKKQITMASRTGRAWLDCQKPTMADQSLRLALEGLEKIRQMLESSAGGSSDECHIEQEQLYVEVDREAFMIYCTKAESSVLQEDHNDGLHWIQKAKSLLPHIPKESTFLAMLCYNFGCDAVEKNKYEATVAWLRTSFELGKGKHPIEPQFQARTLRLLANAYLDWDPEQYSQKALNAVGLANAEHSHPSGLHLKIKILLCTNGSDARLKGAMDDLMGHEDLSVDLAVHTVRMLAQYDKFDLSIVSCRRLATHFSTDPGLGKVYVQHLQLLLGNKIKSEAKMLMKECAADRPAIFNQDVNTHGHLHTILWEQAASAYDLGDNAEALTWYDLSLSFLSTGDAKPENIAKLQRNRASCFLNLQKLDKAMEAVEEAVTNDATSPFTQYILFKVALWRADEHAATEAIQKLSDSTTRHQGDGADNQETVLSLICLAAQLALEKSNRSVAVRALEKLVQHSADQQQILTSLRCLTRLQLTFADTKDKTTEASAVLSYLRTAFDTLKSQEVTPMDDASMDVSTASTNEAPWFMKIAWNLALETSKNSSLTHEFFLFCGKFSQLCAPELSNTVRQKTCLLMAAAAALQMAREQIDREDKMTDFQQCLEHINGCRTIAQEIPQEQEPVDSMGTASVLLILYEFEAHANLRNVPELERILEDVLANPATEKKTLETMAAIAMEPPFKATSICKKALQVVVQRYLESDGVDLNKCSKALHSLVELCLKDGVTYDAPSRQESWGHFKTAVSLMENPDKGITDYPEMEILWLLTRAWNVGIQLLSGGQCTDAEKWCGLAMKIMTHLTSLKSNYEEKMTGIYSEVLDKIEKNKLKGNQEE